MKASELRSLSAEELQQRLKDTQVSLNEARRTHAAGELPNPRVLGNTRREIALLKTLIAEQRRDSNTSKEKDNA